MRFFEEIIKNHMLWASIIAWGVSQLFKIITILMIEKRFDPSRIFGDGGMPSGHSATVTCLAAMCGWSMGFNSVSFAIAMILAVIVMHDAMGVRREVGKQAVLTNEIIAILDKIAKEEELSEIELKEFVGHTPLQVCIGGAIGIASALVAWLLWFRW